MAFWHPCHTLQCWALGAHFGWGHQQMHSIFRATHPQVPKSHWLGMPTAQRRQKITKMPVGAKNSQPQGPSGKELLPHQTTAKTSPEHLWACPSKVLMARFNAASQGGCSVAATWTYAFWGAGRHFTEISPFGRPACHLANVFAPKVGCALKCVA